MSLNNRSVPSSMQTLLSSPRNGIGSVSLPPTAAAPTAAVVAVSAAPVAVQMVSAQQLEQKLAKSITQEMVDYLYPAGAREIPATKKAHFISALRQVLRAKADHELLTRSELVSFSRHVLNTDGASPFAFIHQKSCCGSFASLFSRNRAEEQTELFKLTMTQIQHFYLSGAKDIASEDDIRDQNVLLDFVVGNPSPRPTVTALRREWNQEQGRQPEFKLTP